MASSTREKILAVSLRLFNEQGFFIESFTPEVCRTLIQILLMSHMTWLKQTVRGTDKNAMSKTEFLRALAGAWAVSDRKRAGSLSRHAADGKLKFLKKEAVDNAFARFHGFFSSYIGFALAQIFAKSPSASASSTTLGLRRSIASAAAGIPPDQTKAHPSAPKRRGLSSATVCFSSAMAESGANTPIPAAPTAPAAVIFKNERRLIFLDINDSLSFLFLAQSSYFSKRGKSVFKNFFTTAYLFSFRAVYFVSKRSKFDMEGLHHGKPDHQLFRFFLPPPQRAEPLRAAQHQCLRKLQLPFRQE